MRRTGDDDVYKLFQHLPNTGNFDDYDAAVRVLKAHFDLQLNPDFERFKLLQVRQREWESIDQFHARLQELASTYTEDDQPKDIRAQIMQGCKNKMLRNLIPRQPNISLNEILIMAWSHDLSAARAAEMDMAMVQTPEKAPTVKTKCADAVQMQRTKQKMPPHAQTRQGGLCNQCERDPNDARYCPAQGRACSNCRRMNHFAAVC
ncbi:hypothetical protein NDU88_000388 [Pleurodeles waltl]|uniref:Retrotransposon gag domain-containing protein n=1 Tax=Pleurodeles waltl TaxID=8319 RepID=A0AAV7TH23_PLEWA|nr:hypothetical protein NDU88_000388 [Pleurodeles waltl]